MDFEETASILDEVGATDEGKVPEGQAEPSEEAFIEIKHEGQVKRIPQEKSMDYIQKGYDYETKMSAVKKQNEELGQKLSQYENWEDRFKHQEEINKYYAERPDLYQKLVDAYEGRGNEEADDAYIDPEVASLRKEVETLKQGFQSIAEEKEAQEIAKVQAETRETFDGLKEEHSYLDWNSKDASNLTLEDYITKFAIDNNLTDIEYATYKYCKDSIKDNLRDAGKQEAVGAIKDSTKAGIISTSAIPSRGKKVKPVDTSMDWDSIANEAKDEANDGLY